MQKTKSAAIAIAILLIVSMGASVTLTSAHTPPYQITTYAKVTVLPNPIGVGQSALGYAFLGNAPLSGSAVTNTFRFHNYTVTVTDPNGKVQTFHWDTVTDTTGAQFYRFTPDVVGTWNITFRYGGQVLNSTYFDTTNAAAVGDIYLPSEASCTLTVTQEPATPSFPDSYPLPTEYWTRPIYGENNFWFVIASDWLGIGSPVMSSVSSGTLSGIPLGGSFYQRYLGDAVGPLTSHVMWTKPTEQGGVVGGNRFQTIGDTYMEGSAYNNRLQNPIIVYGRLFYQEPLSYSGSGGDSVCVDLRSGQEIWRRSDLPTISFAYIYDVQSVNQHGVYAPFLVTSNWGRVYDMWTGVNLFNVSAVPGGSLVNGPQGEWIKYNFENKGGNGTANGTPQDWVLTQWNSSKMFTGTGFSTGSGLSPAADTQTLPINFTLTTIVNGVSTTTITPSTFRQVNASLGIRYDYIGDSGAQNRSLDWLNQMPKTISSQTGLPSLPFTVVAANYGNYILCRNGSYPSLTGVTQNVSNVISLTSTSWQYFLINLNASKGAVGSVSWWSPVYSDLQDKTITFGGDDPTAHVFVEACKETYNFVGYSLDNGAKLWETNDPSVNAVTQNEITTLDYFGNPAFPYVATQPAYGKLYSLQYGGYLYCYDLQTGKRLWIYGNGNTPDNTTNSGLQMPGPYPAFINAIGNDVVYIVSTQHTIITPIPKGNSVRAINATSGLQIWSIDAYVGEFFSTSFAIADGYAMFFNGYDDQVYSVGRGPSTTTVSAPSLSAASGEPVVISGTVYDVSSGAKQNEQAARFAKGLPCAADSIMTDYMGYVYQQKPLPTNFKGVEVKINVIDANNNFRTIGTTTTDATGAYNLLWTPDIPGKYSVTAVFEGTQGYWPSYATAAFNVMEAHPTASPAPTAAPSMVEQFFLPSIIGLFVLIIVVAVVMILLIRKRP